jgi:hypothetical protein
MVIDTVEISSYKEEKAGKIYFRVLIWELTNIAGNNNTILSVAMFKGLFTFRSLFTNCRSNI